MTFADYLHEDILEASSAAPSEEFGHGPLGDERSVMHDHYVRAGLLDLTEQMRGDDDGAPGGGIVCST